MKALSTITCVVLFAGLLLAAGACRSPVEAPTTRLSADANTVGLWHCNEGSGQTVTDSSSTGWDLTRGTDATVDTRDPAWTADGMFGRGLSFVASPAGEEDCCLGPGQTGFAAVQEITVEYWLNTTGTSAAYLAVSGNVSFASYMMANGKVAAAVGDGSNYGSYASSTTAINDGVWHYIAFVYDGDLSGGTLSVYVDGDLEVGWTSYGKTMVDPSSWYIGGRPSNSFVDGVMDEVRVSNIARSASEIAANY
jgi:hypothetical protein